MDEEYLTLEECASILKVSDRTIRRWINKGSLPALKIEKTIRVLKSDLDRLGKDVKNPEKESRNPSDLSANTFNRIWDNEVDAETWDNWSGTDTNS